MTTEEYELLVETYKARLLELHEETLVLQGMLASRDATIKQLRGARGKRA